jgi:transcriptional regulator with XRE-family HTH domain
MSLGERVRQLLRERSWSQAQLAEASGLDPSVVSRALGGERPWKKEHIACIAAALSKAPEELVAGTDATISAGESEVDAEFVARLTKDHGALVAENGRYSEEVAAIRKQLERLEEEGGKRALACGELRLDLERERRSKAAAEMEKRASESREAQLIREIGRLMSVHASLAAELDSTRAQLLYAQTAHSQAVELVNRNYAVAKDLERRLGEAKGVAAVTGIFGLAMLVGQGDDNEPKQRRRRASRA